MKFTQYTLNQVAGFDNQILAQQLVYSQNAFWNMQWGTQITTSAGWTTTVNPINLVDATIDAQIIRRLAVNLEDTRTGLNFDIVDYPPSLNYLGVDYILGTTYGNPINEVNIGSTVDLVVGDRIQFKSISQSSAWNYTNFNPDVTYYVRKINTLNNTITISLTFNGPEILMVSDETSTDYSVYKWTEPTSISLPITNRDDATGFFTLTIDDSTWNVLATDPELNISSTNPVCFTGRVKISFPAFGSQPAYDQVIFLLFLIVSDGVVN